MLINADFALQAAITPERYLWVASPQKGVERVMLDRVGTEVARATSLVRYAPDSEFPRHRHPGGEEILVLSGVFSDEHGDYPAGWYLRNPPGSSHRPHSVPGAVIFVKLCQMGPDDTQTVRIDSRDPANWQQDVGRMRCRLFDNGIERVFVENLCDTASVVTPEAGGMEIFVISGELLVGGMRYPGGSWVRLPDRAKPVIRSLGESLIHVKMGHLKAWR